MHDSAGHADHSYKAHLRVRMSTKAGFSETIGKRTFRYYVPNLHLGSYCELLRQATGGNASRVLSNFTTYGTRTTPAQEPF